MTDDARIIEIGGEPLATIEFHPNQIMIDTCCDSVSIFDEDTVRRILSECVRWLSEKEKLDKQNSTP